jgi:hypothetical protein
MQFSKIMAVYSEKRMGNRNKLCGKITECFKVKAVAVNGHVNRKANIRVSRGIHCED